MNLIFLVNGGGAKILLQSIPYPDGADHKIGPYGNRDIYTVTVSFEERTVRAATSLANYRDQVLALEKNKKACATTPRGSSAQNSIPASRNSRRAYARLSSSPSAPTGTALTVRSPPPRNPLARKAR